MAPVTGLPPDVQRAVLQPDGRWVVAVLVEDDPATEELENAQLLEGPLGGPWEVLYRSALDLHVTPMLGERQF